jgi:hypothetical protein
MLRLRKKGQSAAEFTMILIVIFGAFLTMQIYFKRGLQGRWKAAIDDLGDQYDPQTANTNLRQTLESNTFTKVVTMNLTGETWTKRSDLTNSIERKTGFEGAGPY